MNNPAEMSFAQFAEAVKPSGAVNRFPLIGAGRDVFSYSVYMNGPLAAKLPYTSREHEFKDVMVHALVEKLGLDPLSPRDNLKVAEIVAMRSAWMSAVLESSVERSGALPEPISKDYDDLSDGLTHPWIIEQIENQKALSKRLQPALDSASRTVGRVVRDVPPKEISTGVVVAQNDAFTVQSTDNGEVVTHENRRLEKLPSVGQAATVTYYRGSGQVVSSLENMKVSTPYLEPERGNLAVLVEDGKGVAQVVIFNSITGFDKFIKAHGITNDYVLKAMDLRASFPEPLPPPRDRELVRTGFSAVFVDERSGCLAVNYKEGGVPFTALFRSADEMANLAADFSLDVRDLDDARDLEVESPMPDHVAVANSQSALYKKIDELGYDTIRPSGIDGHQYIGKVVAVSALHVAQDVGRRAISIHRLYALDNVPEIGDSLTVKYENGRAQVSDMVRATKDLGR